MNNQLKLLKRQGRPEHFLYIFEVKLGFKLEGDPLIQMIMEWDFEFQSTFSLLGISYLSLVMVFCLFFLLLYLVKRIFMRKPLHTFS